MTVAEQSQTPFDLIGGAKIVRQITDCFYDLMEADPAYAQLRDLHAEDLAPMRVSLAGFLNAWLGGPSDWFVEHPGVCMMSAHARLPITRETADQWADAMRRAITASSVEPVIAGKMAEALGAMAQGMAPNPGQAM